MADTPDHKGRYYTKGNKYSLAFRSPEERFAIQSKGGKVAAQRYKERRKIRDALIDILAAPAATTDETLAEVCKLYGIEDPKQADALALKMVLKAIKDGDVEAAKFARDTSGEKPTTGVEVGNLDDKPFESINLSELSDEELQRMAFTRETADEDGKSK